jgi:hypothetical protein
MGCSYKQVSLVTDPRHVLLNGDLVSLLHLTLNEWILKSRNDAELQSYLTQNHWVCGLCS